jgi:hypothetical protein
MQLRSVSFSKCLNDEQGSILLEAVSFAVLAFGLLLTLSLQLSDLERKQIGLEVIARNSMRYFLLNQDSDLEQAVRYFQQFDEGLVDEDLSMTVSCNPSDCESSGAILWLEISSGMNKATAFGVVQ